MKYVRTAGFLIDLRRLPAEHRKLFVLAVHTLLRPALDAGAHTGAVPWPRALRIYRIGANYSMTWSFSSPDGRALFRLAEVSGETVGEGEEPLARIAATACAPAGLRPAIGTPGSARRALHTGGSVIGRSFTPRGFHPLQKSGFRGLFHDIPERDANEVKRGCCGRSGYLRWPFLYLSSTCGVPGGERCRSAP